jgi:hypothetical protein
MFLSKLMSFGIRGLSDSSEALLILDSSISLEAKTTLSKVVVYLYFLDIYVKGTPSL